MLLTIILTIAAFYIIGTLHCSIKIYGTLKDGQKVYSKLNPTCDDYHETTISLNTDGTKYTTDRDGDKQFRITRWDVIVGRIITEEEYLNLVD